jgi:hypothetical protein
MRRMLLGLVVAVATGCGSPPSAAPASPPGGSAGAALPSLTPAPAPASWRYLPWYDPDLELAVPGDWAPTTTFAQTSPDPSWDPASVESQRWLNGKIAAHAVRMLANGNLPAGFASDVIGGVVVTVESGDASLAAFADRSSTELSSIREVARQDIASWLGPAIVVTMAPVTSAIAGTERDYLFRLADGRSLMIAVSAYGSATSSPPPSAAALTPYADGLVATLRPHP